MLWHSIQGAGGSRAAAPNNLELLAYGSAAEYYSAGSPFIVLSIPNLQPGDLVVAAGASSSSGTSPNYPSIRLTDDPDGNVGSSSQSLSFAGRSIRYDSSGNYNFTVDIRYIFANDTWQYITLSPGFQSVTNNALSFQVIRGAGSITQYAATFASVTGTNNPPNISASGIGDSNRRIFYGAGFSNSNSGFNSRFTNSPSGFVNFTSDYHTVGTYDASICAAVTDPQSAATSANFNVDPAATVSSASAASVGVYIESS